MPEELQDRSYTNEDEENDTDYSTQPKEAMQSPDIDGIIEEDIYDESPVGNLNSEEFEDEVDENEEDQAEEFIETGE
jgi:hypothetical protein